MLPSPLPDAFNSTSLFWGARPGGGSPLLLPTTPCKCWSSSSIEGEGEGAVSVSEHQQRTLPVEGPAAAAVCCVAVPRQQLALRSVLEARRHRMNPQLPRRQQEAWHQRCLLPLPLRPLMLPLLLRLLLLLLLLPLLMLPLLLRLLLPLLLLLLPLPLRPLLPPMLPLLLLLLWLAVV